MNYLKQINAFWRQAANFNKTELRASDIAVYFALLQYANRFGWKKETNIDWFLLQEIARLDIKTFRSSAERLTNINLIIYTKGERNKSVPKFEIVQLYENEDPIENQEALEPISDSTTDSTTDSSADSTTDSKPVAYNKPIKEEKEETNKTKKKDDLVLLVLNHFETVTGKKIRNGIKNPNVKFLRQRLKEKIGVDELCKIIDLKFAEWKGNEKMKKFIRLQTLFNKEKCYNYLEELAEKTEVIEAPEKPQNEKFQKFKTWIVDNYGENNYLAFNLNENNFERLVSGEFHPRFRRDGVTYEAFILPKLKFGVRAVITEDQLATNKFSALIKRIDSKILK